MLLGSMGSCWYDTLFIQALAECGQRQRPQMPGRGDSTHPGSNVQGLIPWVPLSFLSAAALGAGHSLWKRMLSLRSCTVSRIQVVVSSSLSDETFSMIPDTLRGSLMPSPPHTHTLLLSTHTPFSIDTHSPPGSHILPHKAQDVL